VFSILFGNGDDVIAEKPRRAVLVDFSSCDAENEGVELRIIRFQHEAVAHQEDAGSNDGDTFVAINESMIFSEPEKIGCGEFADVFASVSRFVFGPSQRGFKGTRIA